MNPNIDDLIQSIEKSAKLLSEIRNHTETEGDVHFAADYAVDGLYQSLDVLAPRLPSINLVSDLKGLSAN